MHAQNAVPFPLKIYTCSSLTSPEQAHFGSRVIKCVTHWTRTRKSWFLFDCARQLKLNNGFKCA